MAASINLQRNFMANREAPLVSNAVFGTSLLVATEVMFFMGLISAFSVIQASAVIFSPPEGIVLPMLLTAFNTLVLVGSGVAIVISARAARRGYFDVARRWLLVASLSGLFFLSVQGYEWVRLIKYGMSMHSGIYSACFFLLIGSHGLHVAAAVIVMLWTYYRASIKSVRSDTYQALQVFWLFVVGIWPILYSMVYF